MLRNDKIINQHFIVDILGFDFVKKPRRCWHRLSLQPCQVLKSLSQKHQFVNSSFLRKIFPAGFLLVLLGTFWACDSDFDETTFALNYDCPSLEMQYGDSCILNGNIGLLDSNCICMPTQSFDCPNLLSNIGDSCTTSTNQEGIIDENCDCIESFDCPSISMNIGDACEWIDPSGNVLIGIISDNCDCIPSQSFCENLGLFLGDLCFIEPDSTILPLGYVNESCNCEALVFIDVYCTELFLNIGNYCEYIDNNGNILDGTVGATCNCEPWEQQFCESLGLSVGSYCLETFDQNIFGVGIINNVCNCDIFSTVVTTYCPNLDLFVGDSCTYNQMGVLVQGMVNENCECQ